MRACKPIISAIISSFVLLTAACSAVDSQTAAQGPSDQAACDALAEQLNGLGDVLDENVIGETNEAALEYFSQMGPKLEEAADLSDGDVRANIGIVAALEYPETEDEITPFFFIIGTALRECRRAGVEMDMHETFAWAELDEDGAFVG